MGDAGLAELPAHRQTGLAPTDNDHVFVTHNDNFIFAVRVRVVGMKPATSARLRLPLAATILSSAALAGGWAYAGAESTPTAKRIPLAKSKNVRGAKDRTLELSRVVIPAAVELDRHFHEGTQIAFIDKGRLRYTVHSGSVTVRSGSPGEASVVRKIRPGQTGTLRAGDWIVEQPSTQHSAANRGNKKVVVYLADLLKTGAPASTPAGV